MKRKQNHLDYFNDIKKQKFNVELNNLEVGLDNVNLDSSTNSNSSNLNNCFNNNNNNNNNDNDGYLGDIDGFDNVNLINFDNVNLINKDYINNIKNTIDFINKNTNETKLTFDLLIIMSNDIIDNIGRDKYINGIVKDNFLQDKLFSQYISSMFYPYFLFQP